METALSLLDNIRLSNGPEGLKRYFLDTLRIDRSKALELINDKNNHFCTLYILRPMLAEKSAREELDTLYRKALELSELLSGKAQEKLVRRARGRRRALMYVKVSDIMSAKELQRFEKAVRSAGDDNTEVLRWIVGTGLSHAYKDGTYDLIIDRSAALLVKSLKDTTALPEIAELIFERNRNGLLIHELVWAFFEARSPDSLMLLAHKLNSCDKRDSELAKRLLCFIPGISDNTVHNSQVLYTRIIFWLEENRPFLFYTGESLHLCQKPEHYRISLPAKYLCRPVSVDSGEPLMPLSESETQKLAVFTKLPDTLQIKLAGFSWMLYRRNIYQWNTWIGLPVEVQAALALQATEGSV